MDGWMDLHHTSCCSILLTDGWINGWTGRQAERICGLSSRPLPNITTFFIFDGIILGGRYIR